jgi:type VI secretion system secreted protein VgrG
LCVEPKLALLCHRRDQRVFRNRTVPEIVAEVLAGCGITSRPLLFREYRRRGYCVEWRESDLDFIHRLLEDEGIFYYQAGDELLLCDHAAAY